MKDTKLDKIMDGVILTSSLIGLGLGFYALHREVSRDINKSYQGRLQRQVAISVDADKNGLYTHNEWAKVYKSLGIEYNGKEGMDLSKKQLKSYLSNLKDKN